MTGFGASIVKSVRNVVNGFDSRSASIIDGPSSHDASPMAITNPFPSLSSCTPSTSATPVSVLPSMRIHRRCGATWQRWNSSSDPMWTSFSEPPGNSASMIVATPLEDPPSTSVAGSANTPGGVRLGGSTENDVVNDSNGSSSRWAVIMLSPAAHSGPARTTAVALPSASSLTVMPRTPAVSLNGFGTYQVNLPRQRVYSWLAVILIFDPVP